MNKLQVITLTHIKEQIDSAQSELARESVSERKGSIDVSTTHLGKASLLLSNCRQWVEALLEEASHE